jgi:CelD/BcsL family acetyltransferase involved in cellulose biosynthesis
VAARKAGARSARLTDSVVAGMAFAERDSRTSRKEQEEPLRVNDANLNSKLFSGKAGLDAIFPDWEQLMRAIRRQCFYHHPYWFRAFLEAYPGDADRISFVGIYRGADLKAVFPVTVESDRSDRLVVVDLPFGDQLYMADCAIADGEDGAEVYGCFRRALASVTGGRWDVYRARDVLRDSHLGAALLARRRFSQTIYTEKLCAEIPIHDYDEAIRNLKKKFRGNLNNARSKLGRAGEAAFSVDRSADGVSHRFESFVELEMSGWKGNRESQREGHLRPSAIGLKTRKLNFYRSVIEQFARTGNAEISNLTLDGKLIGAQICLLLNDTSYLLKVAYDEDAGRYSPGQLLIDYAYRRYVEEGRIRHYNLITDYQWFEGWNPRYRDYLVIRDFNMTFPGVMASLRSKFGARARDYHSRQTSRKTLQ